MVRDNIASTGLLVAIAGAVTVSQACEWNKDTEKRFKEAKATYCEVLEDMKKDRDERCSKENVPDPVARWQCFEKWDNLINQVRAKKLEAATAFLNCEDETLEQIEKWFKMLSELIKAVQSVTSDEADGIPVSPIDAIVNDITITTASLGLSIPTTITGGVFGAGTTTYTVSHGATWSIVYSAGGLTDTMATTGTLSLVTTNLANPVVGQTYSFGIRAASLQMTAFNRIVSLTYDNTAPYVATVTWDGSTFTGTMAATYVNDEGGHWAAHFPVTFDAAGNLTIATPGTVSGDTIFPVSKKNVGEAIYTFTLDGNLDIGTTRNLHAEMLDPGTPFYVWGAGAVNSDPTVTFLGLPWDLDLSSQWYYTSATASSLGEIHIPVVVPNDPALIGTPIAFQAIGYVNGSPLQASCTVSTIQ
jgi:hypothetical protein